jgi:hypothetical protein
MSAGRDVASSVVHFVEVGADEPAGHGQGLVGLVEHAGEPDEHVGDVGCDLRRDGDAVRCGAGCDPGGAVEEDLVAADLDQQWWDASPAERAAEPNACAPPWR